MKAALRQLFVALFCLLALSVSNANTAYPSQPIRLVVPAGAGGVTDLLARVLAEKLSDDLGQSVVVENRAGASGVIGTSQVVRSKPDGYTLVMVFPSHVANPTTMKELPYDAINDLEPVAKIGKVVEILVVSDTSEFNSINDIIKAAKENPGALNYGSVGVGSLGHLSSVVFADKADVEMTNVSFKSEPEMITALLRGDLDLTFVSPPAGLPMIQGDRLKALAHSDTEVFPMLPDTPTIAEVANLPDYHVIGWNAIYAPKGTPKDIIEKLNHAINKALDDADLIERFKQLGVPPLGGSPEELRKSTIDDIAKVRATLQSAGFQQNN